MKGEIIHMNKTWKRANCYGYAADKNKWLNTDGSYSDMSEELLDRNPSWVRVSKSQMVLGKSYVAFRYGHFDFHFMFRDQRGHWTHKMGGFRVKPISQKQVFNNRWHGDNILYTSSLSIYEVPNR
jgi:hypothetical protein